jgi:hypothetical protein
MAASDHIHPDQLAMFMPAGQIYKTMKLGDADSQRAEDKRDLMDWKHMDNQDGWGGNPPAQEMFDKDGVQTPLEIVHYHGDRKPTLDNGHHRLSWALHKDPSIELPLEHW